MIAPKGSWVAVPTPFAADGSVRFDVFEQLIALHAENGSCALLVMGSCGEATLLTGDERREILRRVTKFARGKITVFFGTTCASTSETVALTQQAEGEGADGVVLTVPPYVTPPEDAVLEHFITVAKSVGLPVALYNNPSRVGIVLSPETIARINREAPNVAMDKEAVDDASQIADVLTATNGRMCVYCCDYPKYGLIPPTLSLGGSGIAGVTGNVAPAEIAELARPFETGTDMDAWRQRYFAMLPLMKAMYWFTNPVVVKAGLNLVGFEVGSVRRPLADLRGAKLEQLKTLIAGLGLPDRYRRYTEHRGVFALGG
jgi:4-hydroxy-tetrahydrodipicolinate synthase